MPYKILSDFDGVLTDLKKEALRVTELFESRLLLESGQPQAEVRGWLEQARSLMRSNPSEYGWKIKGRIAAFCNEDAFIRVNALGILLDEQSETLPALLATRRKFEVQGIEGFYGLAQACFQQMTKETARGEHNPIELAACRTIQTILEKGNQVVVVSNSGTDRVLQLLVNAGLPAESHDTNPNAPLRVRGGAGKFLLGDAPSVFSIGEYKIETDRPAYLKILEEEKPNAVVGDVFSLDLALPLSLAENKISGFEHLKVWLRKRDYTPEWSVEFLSDNNRGVTGGILEGFDELMAVGMV